MRSLYCKKLQYLLYSFYHPYKRSSLNALISDFPLYLNIKRPDSGKWNCSMSSRRIARQASPSIHVTDAQSRGSSSSEGGNSVATVPADTQSKSSIHLSAFNRWGIRLLIFNFLNNFYPYLNFLHWANKHFFFFL